MNVGAAVVRFSVYVAEATALSLQPIAYAIALPAAAVPPVRPSGDGDLFHPARPTLFVVHRRLGLDLKRDRSTVQTFTVPQIERRPPPTEPGGLV